MLEDWGFFRDTQLNPPACCCDACGGELYSEDYVYLFGGTRLCGECVEERVRALTTSEKADLLGAVCMKASECF